MNCDQIKTLVHLELDDELSAEQRRVLQDHLGHCDACRELQAQYGAVAGGLAWLAQDSNDAPGEIPATVPLAGQQRNPGYPLWPRLSAAAAIVLLAGVGWLGWSKQRPQHQPAHVVDVSEEVPGLARREPLNIQLLGESHKQYIAVPQESTQPDVHIVWLYRSDTARPKGESSAPPARKPRPPTAKLACFRLESMPPNQTL